ncbi:hypothetical protein ACFWN7_15020 [Agromyces sp. NPDC058484]|uniref:hypothetical protein n=1 Tax=Agromyces sp. NPDC058484 TaxID=3346524 RepID=UPI00364B73E8
MSAPDPNQLGDSLKRAADAATANAIDVDEVLRRSRARRCARRTAVLGATGAVAAVLAVGGLVLGLQRMGGPTTADAPAFESAESADVSPEATDGGASADAADQRLMAPDQVNRCGAPVAPPTDAATSPLVAKVDAPAASVRPATTNPVTVTITNAGTDVVTGTIRIDAPLTVAESGVTVWHHGPVFDLAPLPIALEPGESASLQGSFETRSCDLAGQEDGTRSTVAPGLGAGEYGLSAVVTFTAPDGAITPLISPLAAITVG